MKRIVGRPSPAMVIAIVALVAALGGTAIAGGVLNKKKVNTIITNRAPGLSVASATSAKSLAAGTPQVSAFAQVSGAGVLGAKSGVNAVSRIGAGQYCFDLASPASAGTATPANTGVAFTTTAFVDIPATAAGCAAPNNDAEVVTGTNTFTDASFYVVFVK
jgi:hypothetical protein